MSEELCNLDMWIKWCPLPDKIVVTINRVVVIAEYHEDVRSRCSYTTHMVSLTAYMYPSLRSCGVIPHTWYGWEPNTKTVVLLKEPL